MRGVAVLALLVGCGRFGFDPTEGVTKGDDGSERTFTIEWRDLDAFFRAGTGNNNFSQGIKVTQSIVLHENGTIDLHYGPRTAPTTDRDRGLTRHEGCSATVGLEASGSGLTTPIQCGTEAGPMGELAPLVEGRLIRFTPG